MYNFDKVINRYGTNSTKWDFASVTNPNADKYTLPMWVADMDFECPEEIIQELHKRVDSSKIFGYSGFKSARYFRAVCNWYLNRFNWYVNSKHIAVYSGVIPAIKSMIMALTEKGDGVVIQKPVYFPFFDTIIESKRNVVNNPLINNNGYYTMDYDDLEEKLSDKKNKIMILCSPHNPVGRVWKPSELIKVAELCNKYNIILISDEIHWDFIRNGLHHIPIANMYPSYKNIITCTSQSKTFNVAGFNLCNVIIPNDDYRKKIKEMEMFSSTANPLSIVVTEVAYERCGEWVDELNKYLDKNFDLMDDFIKKNLPKAVFKVPEGSYLAWVNVSQYTTDTKKLEDDLVKYAKVMIQCGETFGDGGEGFLRINCGCPAEILLEGLNRISNYLNRVKINDKAIDFQYNTPWENNKKFLNSSNRKKCLVFLRFYGCTICQVDIMELEKHYKDFYDKNTDLYIVVQSDKLTVENEREKAETPFEIICDPNSEIYNMYYVKPALQQALLLGPAAFKKMSKSKELGIKHGINEGHPLQLPAVFLFDENDICIYSNYGNNAGDLPDAIEILKQL